MSHVRERFPVLYPRLTNEITPLSLFNGSSTVPAVILQKPGRKVLTSAIGSTDQEAVGLFNLPILDDIPQYSVSLKR